MNPTARNLIIGFATLAVVYLVHDWYRSRHPIERPNTIPVMSAGTWVMDTTNGPDDHGLPKSETLSFAPAATGFRLSVVEDDGKGPSNSAFDCSTADSGAATAMGSGASMRCSVRTTPDSTFYALDMVAGGKIQPVERGRLVVIGEGRMRDEYDSMDPAGKPNGHHRHMYGRAAGAR